MTTLKNKTTNDMRDFLFNEMKDFQTGVTSFRMLSALRVDAAIQFCFFDADAFCGKQHLMERYSINSTVEGCYLIVENQVINK